MITWIHNYNEKNSNIHNLTDFGNFELHRTYYALCQTVFYVIIFRNKQLFQVIIFFYIFRLGFIKNSRPSPDKKFSKLLVFSGQDWSLKFNKNKEVAMCTYSVPYVHIFYTAHIACARAHSPEALCIVTYFFNE